MHFYRAAPKPAAEVVELHPRMVGEQAHGDCGISDAFRDHEGGEALAEGVIVGAGLPDRHFFRLPSLGRTDGDGLLWDHRNVATA